MALLEVNNVSKVFGGLSAVTNLKMKLEAGELVGLIGPNGAGKTTVFNLLTGVYQTTTGDILFDGKNIAGKKPSAINQMGIARTFQNIRLFSDLTVLDNVRIAYHSHVAYKLPAALFRSGRFYAEEDQMAERAVKLLKIFNLDGKKDEIAKNLPYGEQRRLEIARALATEPKFLLLDEPAAGMNPQETAELMNLIRWIRDHFNLTILLIEHDMSLVMGCCERIYVLEYGRVIAQGDPENVKHNPKVIEAYLGEEVTYA
ncbi:MAG TPA: high-affinity branched-chain amino acid ABC transporter ATP-binding protein LivG [Peptococcaceae bacterium]|nr:high-affinity branched-chain amino acid ABC transporter ATP-binding protein LivG [Peptococcaceae bacterium]